VTRAPLSPPPPALLATALDCFTQYGLRTTSTERIAVAAGLSHGSFYRLVGSKDELLEAVDYALDQLQAPLPTASPAQALHEQLARWWQQLATAALAHPEAFAFWRLYRTSYYPLTTSRPDLGPFVPFLAQVEPVLAALPGGSAAHTFSATLLTELLAAQWLAAVEVVLANASCRSHIALREQVLAQTYLGWWRTTGLPRDTPPIPA
jgi:AcrR family transcriptional regulator